MNTPRDRWPEFNQRALGEALADIRARLTSDVPASASASPNTAAAAAVRTTSRPKKNAVPASTPARVSATHGAAIPTTALALLTERFSLSAFERATLLLCAGVEFDAAIASACARHHGDAQARHATFGLALARLPAAHWSALAPHAALRRWRLVHLEPTDGLTASPLRIDERVLHFLAGVPYLEPRLAGVITLVTALDALAPEHIELSRALLSGWTQATQASDCPLVELTGNDPAAHETIIASVCGLRQIRLHRLRADDLPASADERLTLARLWEREAMLTGSALLVVQSPDVAGDVPARTEHFLGEVAGLVALSTSQRVAARDRAVLRLTLDRPAAGDQRALWTRALGPRAAGLNGQLDRLAAQFHLDAPAIHTAAREADGLTARQLGPALWQACRRRTRQALDPLAQRIELSATWDDLILPEAQKTVLRTIAAQVRQRGQVWDDWGFSQKGGRGLGVHALFAGPSGTGKTMAAEVIARDLDLDLYRIDLSALVSKYIGETEKNLRRVFDAAERGGALLLFDEADALFGKRSEVRDSHDRYANIEVSYLLQRLETYRGVAILTSNMKQGFDPAFNRRLRFIVHFAFPDLAQRVEIWRRAFPRETPTERLDFNQLARLSLAGGHIRNVALNAAFLAADAGEPVRMKHLRAAAQSEYAKLEKPLGDAEIGGWL